MSYARPDSSVVNVLRDDLERASHDVWFDQDLQGGQQWWDTILERIRASDLFIFVLSPDSIASQACRAELSYAGALGKQILPVMVRDLNVELAPDPIGSTQIVDYKQRTSESAIALVVAVSKTDIGRRELPDPLPVPPSSPLTGLGPLRERLASGHLDFGEQQALVTELRNEVANTDQHATLLALCEQFLGRSDLAVSVKRDLDALVSSIPIARTTDEFNQTRHSQPTRPLSDLDPDTIDLLRRLVTAIRANHFTPIIGRGLTNSLIGPMTLLAREWARTFDSPTAMRRNSDLPVAAQFVEVMTDSETLRSTLTDFLRSHLLEFHGDSIRDDGGAGLSELLSAAWDVRRSEMTNDPHMVLAELPCPIYVSAHPWNLMVEALRAHDKDPVVELCRWRRDVFDWPEPAFDSDPTYVPSVERPLVYHVFGMIDMPESLVLSTDDYLDFLISVTENRSLIPLPVRRVLADSALLLLGFELEEMDVRVLLRALVNQEGGRKLNKYPHVGAQAELTPRAGSSSREQRYLERYFGKFREPSIDIFWGTVDELTAGLAELWSPAR